MLSKKEVVVFSDTYEGICKLLKANKNIKSIKTFSPYILNKLKNNNKVMCPLNNKKIQKLNYLKIIYSKKIFNYLNKKKLNYLAKYCTYEFAKMEKLFTQAISLEDEDYKKSVIIQKIKGTENDNTLNNSFDKLLNKKKVRIVSYYFKDKNNYYLNESRFDTLKIQSFKTLLYYLFKRFNFLKILFSKKKKFLLLHETFFIRETLVNLFKYGYSFEFTKPKELSSNLLKKDISLDQGVKKIFYSFLNDLLGASKEKDLSKDYLYKIFNDKVNFHISYEEMWKKFFKKNEKPKAIFVGTPKNYIYTSLKHVADELKIPIITFQHGITCELLENKYFKHTFPILDSCFSNYFFSFNNISQKIYQNKFSSAKCMAVGTPKEISNKVLFRFSKKKSKNLTYISSNLYAGHVNSNISKGQNDYNIAKEEIELFEKGLSKVSHKIYFQSYPSVPRYIDSDPIIESVKKMKKIKILDQNKDLKFSRNRSTIFLTKTLSGSFGYILYSKRPVVFFNYNSKPLTKKLQKIFKDLIFYFDSKQNNFYDKVVSFLNQPLDVIDQKWKEKEKERQKFIYDYFGNGDGNAGKRAADSLHQFIR